MEGLPNCGYLGMVHRETQVQICLKDHSPIAMAMHRSASSPSTSVHSFESGKRTLGIEVGSEQREEERGGGGGRGGRDVGERPSVSIEDSRDFHSSLLNESGYFVSGIDVNSHTHLAMNWQFNHMACGGGGSMTPSGGYPEGLVGPHLMVQAAAAAAAAATAMSQTGHANPLTSGHHHQHLHHHAPHPHHHPHTHLRTPHLHHHHPGVAFLQGGGTEMGTSSCGETSQSISHSSTPTTTASTWPQVRSPPPPLSTNHYQHKAGVSMVDPTSHHRSHASHHYISHLNHRQQQKQPQHQQSRTSYHKTLMLGKDEAMMEVSEAESEGVINLSRVKDQQQQKHPPLLSAPAQQRSPRTSPATAATNGELSSPTQNMENGDDTANSTSTSTTSPTQQQLQALQAQSNLLQPQSPGSKPPSSPASNAPSAAKRKVKSASLESAGGGGSGGPPPLLMMAPQQSLSPQQMQQLLQQQVLSPSHLQQLMQQQTLVLQHHTQQKLQEQVMQQLNEQLQINIVQQSQIMQQQTLSGGKSKSESKQQAAVQLQQLQLQQQQIVQQMQLQQRQFLISQGLLGMPAMPPSHGISSVEMQQIWKEIAGVASPVEDICKGLTNGLPSSPNGSNGQLGHHHASNGIPDGFVLTPSGMMRLSGHGNGEVNNEKYSGVKGESEPVQKTPPESTHALYGHGVCKWPGCDTGCDDIHDFFTHLNSEHQLDDRSTAQARVQQQVVSQLERQLSKERERLQAMMSHLHMKPSNGEAASSSSSSSSSSSTSSTSASSSSSLSCHNTITNSKPVKSEPVATPTTPKLIVSHQHHLPVTLPTAVSAPPPSPMSLITSHSPMALLATPTPPVTTNHSHHHHPGAGPPPPLVLPTSPQNTPISGGPGPIRRRVSDKCNLPISAEIQRNRDFYKTTDVRPPFTYASLIRQAIIESPEKQLTLNEIYQWFQNTFAFFRKNQATWKNAVRHNLSLHKCFMRVENVKGAVWTVDEIEFYKRRPQKMSGNLQLKNSASVQQSSSFYGESLNASLRAALAESNLPMLNPVSLPMEVEAEYAEDLSVSGGSRNNLQPNDLNHQRDHEPEDLSNDQPTFQTKMEKLEQEFQQQESELRETREPSVSANSGLQSKMEQMAVMQSVHHDHDTAGRVQLSEEPRGENHVRREQIPHQHTPPHLLPPDHEEGAEEEEEEAMRRQREEQLEEQMQQDLQADDSILREQAAVVKTNNSSYEGLEEQHKQQAAQEAVLRHMKNSFQDQELNPHHHQPPSSPTSSQHNIMVENPEPCEPVTPHVIMPTTSEDSPVYRQTSPGVEPQVYDNSSQGLVGDEQPEHSTPCEN